MIDNEYGHNGHMDNQYELSIASIWYLNISVRLRLKIKNKSDTGCSAAGARSADLEQGFK